jgi:hypothetical protein
LTIAQGDYFAHFEPQQVKFTFLEWQFFSPSVKLVYQLQNSSSAALSMKILSERNPRSNTSKTIKIFIFLFAIGAGNTKMDHGYTFNTPSGMRRCCALAWPR